MVGSLAVGITSPPRPNGTICVPYAYTRFVGVSSTSPVPVKMSAHLLIGYTRPRIRPALTGVIPVPGLGAPGISYLRLGHLIGHTFSASTRTRHDHSDGRDINIWQQIDWQ